MLTKAKLKELFNYDENTGLFFRKLDANNGRKAGEVAGYIDKEGYVVIAVDGRNYYAHRLVFLYMEGCFPDDCIDHADKNKANNKLSNLRKATKSENGQNLNISVRNTSGYTGVYYEKSSNRWRARIVINKKSISLGRHKSPELAYEAYKIGKAKYHSFQPFQN
jgi:hypothetical protein